MALPRSNKKEARRLNGPLQQPHRSVRYRAYNIPPAESSRLSIAVSKWAWEQDLKNARHKLLLIKLADSANDDGVCWPSIRTLAKHTGISKSAISRTAKALEECSYLRIQETLKADGSKGANVYHLSVEGVSHPGGTGGVSHPERDRVSHQERDRVSHPERDRTVREPSVEPSKDQDLAPSVPPKHLGDRRWEVSSSPGRGPFEADLDEMSCTCENRSSTPCRHLRAAAKADEKREAERKKALRNAVWDGLAEAFGQATDKQSTSYGSNVNEIIEHLANEGAAETPEAYRAEVDRRVAALRGEWGVSRVTRHAFVQNWNLAGKIGAPRPQQEQLDVEPKYGGDEEVL